MSRVDTDVEVTRQILDGDAYSRGADHRASVARWAGDASSSASVRRIAAVQSHIGYAFCCRSPQARGAIEFESSEVRFVLGPQGEVVQAGMLQRNDAHKLIEECMIAANVEAARFLLKKKVPAPYRIHDKPPESKYADLLEFLKEFKLRMPAWAGGAAARFHHC